MESKIFTSEPTNTETNIMHILVREDIPIMKAAQLLGNVADDETEVLGKSIQVNQHSYQGSKIT